VVTDEKNKRGVRIFACPYCGHHLRFGRNVCRSCYRPTPFYNRRVALVALLAMIAMVATIFTIGGTSGSA
jgi:hypothetical protein